MGEGQCLPGRDGSSGCRTTLIRTYLKVATLQGQAVRSEERAGPTAREVDAVALALVEKDLSFVQIHDLASPASANQPATSSRVWRER